MEFSRFKKMIAGASVAAVTFLQVGTALAYTDVPAGAWFAGPVDAFVAAGHLDASQDRFRPGDLATRAEFVKLVVALNGGVISTPPAVPSFDDVATSAWYYDYFEEAGVEGWVRGDGDCYGSHPCYARPNANVNRAEAAALIVRAFALDATGAAPQFVDNPSGQWYTGVIQTSADNCVLQGDDRTGRVRPGDNMNRAEMVVMLHRADQNLQYGRDCGDVVAPVTPEISDVDATSSTTVEVDFNVDLDTAVDETYFQVANGASIDVIGLNWINDHVVELELADPLVPNDPYTVTATDVWSAAGVQFSDSSSFAGYSPVVTGDGVLEATLSSRTPVGDTVPKGAIGVTFLTVDLTASCDDDVVLDEITAVHEGLGDEEDIDGVYVMVDQARLSRKRTIDSDDQTADLRLASPLVINRCDTATVKIVADIKSDAQAFAEHNFVVQLPSDVRSNAQAVNGNFPLRGDTFRIAAVASGILSVEFRTVTPDEVEVGDTKVVVGKFQFQADSTEDQTLYSVTLENDGSASDGDFVNIHLRRSDGTVVSATEYSTQSDFVTLEFDPPLTITEGDKVTFDVVADIVDGASDTVQLQFEEESDIFAVGALYGFGVNGQLYGSRVNIDTTTSATAVSIDAGEFNISIDGPISQDYTNDTDDANLANIIFEAAGEEPIDVKDIFMLIRGRSSTGGHLCASGGSTALGTDCGSTGSDDEIHEVLEDVEIRNTVSGRSIDGVRLTAAGNSGKSGTTEGGTFQVYRFDDYIVRGKETWQFQVDFIDNGAGNHPKSGDEFTVYICTQPKEVNNATNSTGCNFGGVLTNATVSDAGRAFQMDVEGLSTGDKVQDVRPRTTITGNDHRIEAAELQITVQSIGATETTVRNAKDVKLVRIEARAGEAEDILLTQIAFESATGATSALRIASLQSAENYTLWADTDGDKVVDTIVEAGVSEEGEKITFSELNDSAGHVIPRDKTVIFELHADISSSLQANTLQLKVSDDGAVTDPTIEDLEAEQVDDGDDLEASEVTYTAVDSKLWILSEQGNLFVTSGAQDREHILLGGMLSDVNGSVLNLEFRAEDEPIDVEEVRITSSGNNAEAVESLALFIAGESTPFETAESCSSNDGALTVNDNGRSTRTVKTFCASMGNQQLVIPEGQKLEIQVRPNMKPEADVGTLTGTGRDLQFFLHRHVLDATNQGTGAVLASGLESNKTLTENDGDATAEGEVFIGLSTPTASTGNSQIPGNENIVAYAKYNSITNGFDFGGTVPGITGTNMELGAFKFTAASTIRGGQNVNGTDTGGPNQATLSGLILNVNASNVGISSGSFILYNQRQDNVSTACSVLRTSGAAYDKDTASGAFAVVCQGINLAESAGGIEEYAQVEQGQSEIFILEGNVTEPRIDNNAESSLTVSLQRYNNFDNTTFGVTTSHLNWLDAEDDAVQAEYFFTEQTGTTVQSTTFRG